MLAMAPRTGGKVYVQQSPFDMAKFVKFLAIFPITIMFTIPPLIRYLALSSTPDTVAALERIANMYIFGIGAAPLGADLEAQFMAKITAAGKGTSKVRVMQAYGMTELSAAVCS